MEHVRRQLMYLGLGTVVGIVFMALSQWTGMIPVYWLIAGIVVALLFQFAASRRRMFVSQASQPAFVENASVREMRMRMAMYGLVAFLAAGAFVVGGPDGFYLTQSSSTFAYVSPQTGWATAGFAGFILISLALLLIANVPAVANRLTPRTRIKRITVVLSGSVLAMASAAIAALTFAQKASPGIAFGSLYLDCGAGVAVLFVAFALWDAFTVLRHSTAISLVD